MSDTPGQRLQLWGTWVADLPHRVGANRALDHAVLCVVHGHQQRIRRDNALLTQQGRKTYGEALLLLQAEINAGNLSLSTVVTTRLLIFYKLFPLLWFPSTGSVSLIGRSDSLLGRTLLRGYRMPMVP